MESENSSWSWSRPCISYGLYTNAIEWSTERDTWPLRTWNNNSNSVCERYPAFNASARRRNPSSQIPHTLIDRGSPSVPRTRIKILTVHAEYITPCEVVLVDRDSTCISAFHPSNHKLWVALHLGWRPALEAVTGFHLSSVRSPWLISATNDDNQAGRRT